MQKLVTIYLDNSAYIEGKWIIGSFAEKHLKIEEHLDQYLSTGWSIKSVAGFGGSSDSFNAKGWFAVVLEK